MVPHPIPDIRRVLITTDTIGGVWYYTLELARGLKKLGMEPLIAAFGETPAQERMTHNDFAIHTFPCRLEWMQDPWEDVHRSGEWLRNLSDRYDPDVVHLNTYAHAAMGFSAPVLVVGHSCVFSWYQAVKGRAPSRRWDRYHKAVQMGLAAADGVTAPTAAMLAELDRYYGPFKKCHPIPNGREIADFPVSSAKTPIVLSAGRIWDAAKNISALAQVAEDLSWPVMVAGEQRHPDGGQTPIDNVHPLGFLNQLQFAAWLSKTSIYALPALYEPFGLTVLEAALAGCALVLGDIPSLRETWDGAAVFVPPRRTDLLRSALECLIEDPKLRHRRARKARQRALEFTAEKMARAYLALYQQLSAEQGVQRALHRRA
jgi:glycosyltransferase involved in cell wall biosynthesis